MKMSFLLLSLTTFICSACNVSQKDENVAMKKDSIESILKNESQFAEKEEDKILKEAKENGYDDSISFKKRLTNYIEHELDFITFRLADSLKISYTQLSIQNINFKSYTKGDIGVLDVAGKLHANKEVISWLSDKNIACLINEKIVTLNFDTNSFRNTLPQKIAYFKHNGTPYVLVSFYILMYASSRSYFENILFQFDDKNNVIGHYLISTVSAIPNYENLGDFDGDGSLDYLARVGNFFPKHEIAIQANTIYNIEKDSIIFNKYTLVKEDYD
jgi:uncharacterized HAD superfamily protein